MDTLAKNSNKETYSTNDHIPEDGLASAHAIGQDSWQQVGLLLATSFNCGWVLSYSALTFTPLGWTWGIIGLIVIGLFTVYANWLLAGFHYIEGRRFIRYRDIMGFLFGKRMYYITWILQFSMLLIVNMAFILLGGRALKEINLALSDTTLRLQYFIIITGVAYFIFAVVVPNMSAMRLWLGASAILALGYIGILVVLIGIDGKPNIHRDYNVPGNTEDKVFNALGAVSAIILTKNSGMLLEIQATVREPAIKNMRKALYLLYAAGLPVIYGMTIIGYWAYGSAVSDYLPTHLSKPKWAKALINAAVYVQLIISQHMFIQPVYEALDTKFLKLDKDSQSRENIQRRFFLRALFFTLTTVVAAAIPFIGYFINFMGAFSLTPLTFIFPSMIFIKVKGKTARAVHKAWHWAIIFVFSIVTLATTIAALRLMIISVRNYHLFADV